VEDRNGAVGKRVASFPRARLTDSAGSAVMMSTRDLQCAVYMTMPPSGAPRRQQVFVCVNGRRWRTQWLVMVKMPCVSRPSPRIARMSQSSWPPGWRLNASPRPGCGDQRHSAGLGRPHRERRPSPWSLAIGASPGITLQPKGVRVNGTIHEVEAQRARWARYRASQALTSTLATTLLLVDLPATRMGSMPA